MRTIDELVEWRIQLVDRLLEVELVLSVATLPFVGYYTYEQEGPWPMLVGALALSLACFARFSSSKLAKVFVGVASFAAVGLASLLFNGTNGVAVCWLAAAYVMATLFLGKFSSGAFYTLASISVVAIVGLQASHLTTFRPVDATQLQTWAAVALFCAPSFAVALVAQSRVVHRLTSEAAQLEDLTGALQKENEARRQTQFEVDRVNEALEKAVVERTADHIRITEDLSFFSEVALAGIRGPLLSIQHQIERVHTAAVGKWSKELESVLASSTRRVDVMLSVVEELRALGAVSSQEVTRQPVDISQEAQTVLSQLREAHPDRDVIAIVEPGILAEADLGLVKSALRNLIENAWKFTVGSALARIEILRWQDGGEPGFMVRDNGPGLGASTLEELSKPFVRGRTTNAISGSGIGLSTVKRIVDRHQGSFTAKTLPVGGAQFMLEFGKAVEAPAEDPTRSEDIDIDPVRSDSGADWKVASLKMLLLTEWITFSAVIAIDQLVISYAPR